MAFANKITDDRTEYMLHRAQAETPTVWPIRRVTPSIRKYPDLAMVGPSYNFGHTSTNLDVSGADQGRLPGALGVSSLTEGYSGPSFQPSGLVQVRGMVEPKASGRVQPMAGAGMHYGVIALFAGVIAGVLWLTYKVGAGIAPKGKEKQYGWGAIGLTTIGAPLALKVIRTVRGTEG